MKYFSGFALKNDIYLCKEFLLNSDFTVAGLSFGAIKAIEYTLSTDKRVDTLQLFSPAFFQNRNDKFKRTQIIYFLKNRESYIKNFIKNSFFPSNPDSILEIFDDSVESLQQLLEYRYSDNIFTKLEQKGVKIEIYLGSDDKIIDSHAAKEYFTGKAEIFFLQNRGHFLILD